MRTIISQLNFKWTVFEIFKNGSCTVFDDGSFLILTFI